MLSLQTVRFNHHVITSQDFVPKSKTFPTNSVQLINVKEYKRIKDIIHEASKHFIVKRNKFQFIYCLNNISSGSAHKKPTTRRSMEEQNIIFIHKEVLIHALAPSEDSTSLPLEFDGLLHLGIGNVTFFGIML